MIEVSKLLFDKRLENSKLKEFFKTKHSKYFEFDNSDIFTLTTYENRVGALGMTAPPNFLKFSTIKLENNNLIFDNNYILNNYIIYDPKITQIFYFEPLNKNIELLKEKIDNRIFKKIITTLNEKKYDDLIGFGPGLTPLFDDILSGILLINSIKRKFDDSYILEKAKYKTNKLSYFQLSHSSKGYAPKPVKEYLEKGNKANLLNMGDTSGLGWIIGISFFFDLEG
ncbi:DUF2877 domain-containing protein [Marinitoga sp. 38H-ov]|uniref:oxamate carbamoyltransferase subunit AllH family protein n=1 Tax=Marinitoga sp. 38H-ov TaxID=1755814 RepID=UPI0013EE228B|nr:DUF2877 domain-containing protein [Marinitoga sp. 38H-ov]KAF2956571.1 hypothetical protein AS160_05075 [Marinitoga sp. 38H-ov]